MQQTVTAEEARALYAGAVSIDGLANPGSMNVPWPPKGPLSPAQRANIAKSGLTAINATVSADRFEPTVANIALWTREAARCPALLTIIRRHDDIARAKKAGQFGIILGFQDTEMIERDLARLDTFRQLGVLIVQLTYNVRNLIGDGCLEPGDAGLSRHRRITRHVAAALRREENEMADAELLQALLQQWPPQRRFDPTAIGGQEARLEPRKDRIAQRLRAYLAGG